MQTDSLDRSYIADNGNGTFAAYWCGKDGKYGSECNLRLHEALALIRHCTGCAQGAVRCYDRVRWRWDSELDLSEGV